MTVEEIRQAVMRRRTEQGLAVNCVMPDHGPVMLYFASPETRDDFMDRATRQGGAVEIANAP